MAKPPLPSNKLSNFIGNTPIVKLSKLVNKDMADVFIKLEGQNPAGSIKDRTALGLILDAEERGILSPGSGQTIIEPTSGNTGIGLAFLAAMRGYKCIIVLPDSMSEERKKTLKAYGAQLEYTPGHLRMQAAIPRAKELAAELNAFMPNQFENPANPNYHYRITGPEIWQQMQGQIDAFVWGSGTGGSISGIGKYLKEQNPNIKIYAVEPARSAVINGHKKGNHRFQGMGPGFIPKNLNLDILDGAKMVYEEDAFPLARRLAKEEGVFVGMSSGAAAWVALELAKELGPNKRILTLAADSAARYISTELFEV